MKLILSITLTVLLLPIGLLPQSPEHKPVALGSAFIKQLMHDGVTIFLSPELAKDLLLHKEEIVWHHHGMEARVSGTVVVGLKSAKMEILYALS
jgi:hypothetical protein